MPALRISKIGTASAMNAGARTAVSAGGRSGRLLPKVLVTAQVVVSLVLLAGAGLLVRTLRNLQNQDFGFDRHHVLLVEFNAKFAGYKPAQLNGLYETMRARMDALPGVRSASLSGGPPMSAGSWNSPIFFEGHAARPNEDRQYSAQSSRASVFRDHGNSSTARAHDWRRRHGNFAKGGCRQSGPGGSLLPARRCHRASFQGGRPQRDRRVGDRRHCPGCEVQRPARRAAPHGLPCR